MVVSDPRRQGVTGPRPERLQLVRDGRPDRHVVAVLDEVTTKSAEIRLRTAEGGRVSLDEVGHPHGRSFADGMTLEGRGPAGYHNRSACRRATAVVTEEQQVRDDNLVETGVERATVGHVGGRGEG